MEPNLNEGVVSRRVLLILFLGDINRTVHCTQNSILFRRNFNTTLIIAIVTFTNIVSNK